jgi:hypothetical protein
MMRIGFSILLTFDTVAIRLLPFWIIDSESLGLFPADMNA